MRNILTIAVLSMSLSTAYASSTKPTPAKPAASSAESETKAQETEKTPENPPAPKTEDTQNRSKAKPATVRPAGRTLFHIPFMF